MTAANPHVTVRPRYFPSKFVLIAAGELIFIAAMLRWSNSPAFFAAAVACSLGAIQLGAVLISRFRSDTSNVRKLAQAAEFSSQAVIITDPDGRIKWANGRFTDLTGFNLANVAGKRFSMLLHGQKTDTSTVESIRTQMRLELPFTVEILQYNNAGQEFWVSSKGEPCRNARGYITHYVLTQGDVSDQRRQSLDIETLAEVIAVGRAAEHDIVAPEPGTPRYPANDPALRLAQQLESLTAADDRSQLQKLIDGMKTRIEDCVEMLSPETMTSHAAQPGE